MAHTKEARRMEERTKEKERQTEKVLSYQTLQGLTTASNWLEERSAASAPHQHRVAWRV